MHRSPDTDNRRMLFQHIQQRFRSRHHRRNLSGKLPRTKEIYNVAIVKQLDHASLDEIANAVEAELDKIAEDNNVTIHYELYSGQNDQTTLKQIGDQAVADGVDAIIPIATLAAQVATVSAQQTQTPVVYAAVSDPEAAELTGIDYVTGTSDALNTKKIMDMILPQTQMLKM